MASRFLSHGAVFLMWLLHFLPHAWLARLGEGLGALLYKLGKRRRRIVEINLRQCFLEKTEDERSCLAQAHFRMLGRSLLERSLFWWASAEELHRLIEVCGTEKIRALLDSGRPVIMLAPHFLGLDAGGVALAMRFDSLSTYSEQKNKVFNELILRGRKRFGDQYLLSRQDGIRSTIRAMRSGRPYYYLPDMDFGRRDSVFVPFFGVPAATITGLPRLARAAGAAIAPCITRMLPGTPAYRLEVGDAWESFPSDDVEADARRMNAFIEESVLTMPEQYYWVHRRFKTRPEGEPGIY